MSTWNGAKYPGSNPPLYRNLDSLGKKLINPPVSIGGFEPWNKIFYK